MTVAAGDAREGAADAARPGYDTMVYRTLNQVLNGVASVQGACEDS